MTLELVVVGGGAAGYFAAIAAAEQAAVFGRDLRVTIVEATKQVLAKVRISGGGRCNVTHSCFEPRQLVNNYPRGQQALAGALSSFWAAGYH